MVLSCDLPRFDARLVAVLRDAIDREGAAAPYVDGFRQPLVALYRNAAFASIPDDATCPMDWLDSLETLLVDEATLGGLADATRGANTPEEFKRLTGSSPSPSGSSWRGG